MEDKKKQLKKQLKKTVKLAENLQEPRNDEEQKMLDTIMNDIKDLDNYLDDLSIDGKN